MKKFEVQNYLTDLKALGFTVALFVFPGFPLHSISFAVGALLSALPKLIMLSFAETSSLQTEKIRSAIFFCIYFFAALWSTDFQTPTTILAALFGAALYQLSLCGMLRYEIKRKEHSSLASSSTH